MPDHAAHLQAVLDAAIAAAKAAPTSANIGAMEKARRAVDDYAMFLASDAAGEKFKTQAAALDYLQRRFRIEKSKLSKDVQDGKVLRKNGVFTAATLDNYAITHRLPANDTEPLQTVADGSDRLKAAMAEEREIRVAQLKGNLIDAAEEEARDARLWFAVRSDIENHGPNIINNLINRIADLGLPEDITAQILNLIPELRSIYEDSLAEIFDRYARDGGIEA